MPERKPDPTCRAAVIAAACAILLAGCAYLPDLTTTADPGPPSVQLTFSSGDATGTVDATGTLPVQHVEPGRAVVIEAEASSSVVGLQSLEIEASGSFTCRDRNVAKSGKPDFAPIVNAPPASGPVVLRLTTNVSLGVPERSCTDLPFDGWTGSVTAIAVNRDGLKTASRPLSLVSP